MAAFTTVTSGTTDVQLTSFINEIVRSWSEHRLCIGQTAFDATITGLAVAGTTDIQVTSFWADMQSWCYVYCTSFVNHTLTIEGATSIDYFTQGLWRTEAGIPSGFRRATTFPTDWTDYSDAAYSYGDMQYGDIIGPWIFVDMQNALSALKWTYDEQTYTSGGGYHYIKSYSSTKATLSAAISDVETNWPSTWTPTLVTSGYGFGRYLYEARMTINENGDPVTSYQVSCFRSVDSNTLSGIPTHISHSADTYLFLAAYTTFYDFDGGGDWNQDRYSLLEQFSSATVTSRIFGHIPTTKPSPYNDAPIQNVYTSPAQYGIKTERDGGTDPYEYAYSATYWILKWDFTNQD